VSVIALVLAGMVTFAAQAERFTSTADKLIAAINAGDQKTIQAMFTPEMQKALPADKAQSAFEELIHWRGKMLSIGCGDGRHRDRRCAR